jgi:hypothetical protein
VWRALPDQLLDEVGRHSGEASADDHRTALGHAAQQRLDVADHDGLGAVDEASVPMSRRRSLRLSAAAEKHQI